MYMQSMVNKHRKFYFLPTLSATLRWNLLFSCWPDENFIVTQDPDEIHKIPLCTSFCLRHIFSTRKRSLWSQPLNISSIPLLQSSLISEPTSRLMPWTTTDFLLMLLILHEHFTPLGANFGCWGDLIDIVLFRYISPPQSENLKKKQMKKRYVVSKWTFKREFIGVQNFMPGAHWCNVPLFEILYVQEATSTVFTHG